MYLKVIMWVHMKNITTHIKHNLANIIIHYNTIHVI